MATRVCRLRQTSVAKALRKSRLHGPFFCSRYGFSPYQGCGHGCLYCDGRAERYYVDGEFDVDIVARTNLVERLAEELPKLREPGIVDIGSGVSDAYQPVEAELELTRRAAKLLAARRFPVVLATKSSLVERDLDIWGDLARNAGFTLLMSIVTTDDALRARVEPGASSIAERLATLRRFKEAGATTGVLAMPILPGLGDSEDELRRLFRTVADAGVDCIIPGNLTLRPGRQKDLFVAHIRERHPALSGKYDALYSEERQSGNTTASYRRSLYWLFACLLEEVKLPAQIPHAAFAGRIPPPDEIYLLLCHMRELYARKGIDVRRLEASLVRYGAWLDDARRTFNRRRSLDGRWVTRHFETALQTEPEKLFDNPKVTDFVQQALAGYTFDYCDLKFRPRPAAAG